MTMMTTAATTTCFPVTNTHLIRMYASNTTGYARPGLAMAAMSTGWLCKKIDLCTAPQNSDGGLARRQDFPHETARCGYCVFSLVGCILCLRLQFDIKDHELVRLFHVLAFSSLNCSSNELRAHLYTCHIGRTLANENVVCKWPCQNGLSKHRLSQNGYGWSR